MRVGSLFGATYGIAGSCSRQGFYLRVGNGRKIQSANFNFSEEKARSRSEEESLSKKVSFVWMGISIVYFIIGIIGSPQLSNFYDVIGLLVWLLFFFIVSSVCAISLAAILLFRDISGPDTAEWHACEHKTAMLISERLEPTIENLKRMPRVNLQCGSVMAIEIGLLPAYFVVFLLLLSSVSAHWMFLFVPVIPMSIIFFALVLQYLCCTKDPSAEKLEQALAVARQFYNEPK